MVNIASRAGAGWREGSTRLDAIAHHPNERIDPAAQGIPSEPPTALSWMPLLVSAREPATGAVCRKALRA
jgi:hypothetical protein